MYSKRIIMFIVLSFLCFTAAMAGTPSDSLFIKGKKQLSAAVNSWNIQNLMSAKSFFERLLNADDDAWLTEYYIGLADNRIAVFYIGKQNKELAKKYVDDAIFHLEKSIDINESFAESYALLSNVLGTKIGLKPILGMTLGMKSGTLIGKAFELEPENPRVNLIAGQSAFYTPKMFGGGKQKAMDYINKAILFFKSYKIEKQTYPSWGNDEAYAYQGLIYMDLGKTEMAKASFNKALEINPDYSWVKYFLLPKLMEKSDKK